MVPPVKKKRTPTAKKKVPPTKKTELQKKNLNVSAGRVFYERASSRRSRHRDALMNQESFPLKRASSITDKSKKRRVFTDAEEDEERMEQKGKMRFAKISWSGGRRPSLDRARSGPGTCMRSPRTKTSSLLKLGPTKRACTTQKN